MTTSLEKKALVGNGFALAVLLAIGVASSWSAGARTTMLLIGSGILCAFAVAGFAMVMLHRELAGRRHVEQEMEQLRVERKQWEGQRAALNDHLRRRTEELEAANKELEAFSYSVSHDLRAPLRHVSGFADLLLRTHASRLDETGQRRLEVIAGAAEHMGQLIDDLLVFSRMGRAELQRSTVDLNALVQGVVKDLETEAAGRTLRWSLGPLPAVEADPAMLRLVFQNLLANAVKFTSKRAEARIEVGARMDPEHGVVIFVRDNGVGFDMQYVQKLFGVFQRLHRADEFPGTGIGLANVRRIVHRHGGKTWAEGAVEQGATLSFSLPAREKEEAACAA